MAKSQSAVSRQREYLADASAVQFTRQTDGIAGALKKIGGYTKHSYITQRDPEEVSHMLIASGAKRFTSMFATHPPLEARIKALDPQFDESDYPTVVNVGRNGAYEQVSGFSDGAEPVRPKQAIPDSISTGTVSKDITAAVGNPDKKHVQFAQKLRESIPPSLYTAAHSGGYSYHLAIALSLGGDLDHANRQLAIVKEEIGEDRRNQVRDLYDDLVVAGPVYRLPLLEIAFPALKRNSAEQLGALIKLVKELVQSDGTIDLTEYCFYRILRTHLQESMNPAKAGRGNRTSKKSAQQAAIDLVHMVSNASSKDSAIQSRAFDAGTAVLGAWSSNIVASNDKPIVVLDRSLNTLAQINSADAVPTPEVPEI